MMFIKYKKVYISIIVLFFLIFSFFINEKVFSSVNESNQDIIINLTLNDSSDVDFEIVVDKNGLFYVPFKEISNLLKSEVTQDHLTKKITFKNKAGLSGIIDYKNKSIVFNNNLINFEKTKPIFLKKGIMDNIVDEVFLPINIVNELLDIKLNPNYQDYSITLINNEVIALPEILNENKKKNNNQICDLIEPHQKSSITVDSITLNNNWQSIISKQTNIQIQNPIAYNENNNVDINGKFFKGNYTINLKSNTYNEKLFSFGGVGIGYKGSYKNIDYQLGNISGFVIDNSNITSGLLGIQLDKQNKINTSFKDIKGKVDPLSEINLLINDKESISLNTLNGYYSLENLPAINDKIYKLKIDELTADGKQKTLNEFKYSKFSDLLCKGDKNYSVLSGLAGYQNTLFNNNSYSSSSQDKKFVIGGAYNYGLTDNLTLSTFAIADTITAESDFSNNLMSGDNSIRLGSSRDFNSISGQTLKMMLKYQPKDNLKLTSNVGLSHANSKNTESAIAPIGLGIDFKTEYFKNNYILNAGIFGYSPGYYMAGSTGYGFYNDRIGLQFGGSYNFKYITLNGNLKKYTSNYGKYLSGGLYNGDDYYLSCNIPFSIKYFYTPPV